MKTYYFHRAFPFLLLFFGTNCPAVFSQIQPTPSYQFEEEKLPSASPCAVCVGFEATKLYAGGNISWNICQFAQARGYLDLKLVRGTKIFKVRLLRDCSNPAQIKVLRCSPEDAGFKMITAFVTSGDGNRSHVLISENGIPDPVLKVTIPSGTQIGIELKTGWKLSYDRHSCTAGGN